MNNLIRKRPMRKTLCAAAFVLALYSHAFAGDIPNPLPPQPPPLGMAVGEPVTGGDIPMTPVIDESMTLTVLSLLESLLTL
jgi:hypothetical protein